MANRNDIDVKVGLKFDPTSAREVKRDIERSVGGISSADIRQRMADKGIGFQEAARQLMVGGGGDAPDKARDRHQAIQARMAQRSVRMEERRLARQDALYRRSDAAFEKGVNDRVSMQAKMQRRSQAVEERRQRREEQRLAREERANVSYINKARQFDRRFHGGSEQDHLLATGAAENERRRRAEARQNMRRVRPGEELDAARAAAERDAVAARNRQQALQARMARNSTRLEEQRLAREERQRRSSINQARSAQRTEMFDDRRGNFDLMMAGGMIGGAGMGIMGGIGGAAMAYGKEQMARVGLQSLEGANADNVFNQAQSDAKNMMGANYLDVINYQNQLRQAGQGSEAARQMVKNLSDVNAAMGGTSDRMQRLVYNLSQVESQGKLTGRDLRDFAVNLLPIREYIARVKGIGVGDVADKVSAGEVSAADVRAAIGLMGNDPKFKDRGRQLTETTLQGQLEKTQEELLQTAAILGKTVTPSLMKLNEVARGGLEWVGNLNPTAQSALAWTGAGLGGAAVLGGGAMAARGGLGMIGQALPGLTNSKLGNAVFGGGAFQQASNKQLVAAEMQVAAARMQLGGGAAGALPGIGGGAAASGAASTGAAAGAGWLARSRAWAAAPAFSTTYGASALTRGAMLGSAAVGGAAGMGVYDDTGNMGQALGTGAASVLAAAFLPHGMIAVAAATGLRYALNEAYNRPMERAAETGTLSEENLKALRGASARSQSDTYFKARDEALAGGDSVTAESFAIMANMQRRKANRQSQDTAATNDDAEFRAHAAANGVQVYGLGTMGSGPGAAVSNGSRRNLTAHPSDDGGYTVHFPAHPAVRDLVQATR